MSLCSPVALITFNVSAELTRNKGDTQTDILCMYTNIRTYVTYVSCHMHSVMRVQIKNSDRRLELKAGWQRCLPLKRGPIICRVFPLCCCCFCCHYRTMWRRLASQSLFVCGSLSYIHMDGWMDIHRCWLQ